MTNAVNFGLNLTRQFQDFVSKGTKAVKQDVVAPMIRNAFNMAIGTPNKPAVTQQKVPNTDPQFQSISNKAIASSTPPTNALQQARNFVLDMPFKIAQFKDKWASMMLPHQKMKEEYYPTASQKNAAYEQDMRVRKQNPMGLMLEGGMQELGFTPESSLVEEQANPYSGWGYGYYEGAPSAQLLPYIEPLPSDLNEAQTAQLLNQFNLRPAAYDYFSQIPIKVGEQYLNSYNETGQLPGGQWNGKFVAVNPYFIDENGQQQPIPPEQLESAVMHEYGHSAPRMLPSWTIPLGSSAEAQEYAQRWGPDYFARSSNPEEKFNEERFAEGDLPPEFFYHIFNPETRKGYKGKTRIKIRKGK